MTAISLRATRPIVGWPDRAFWRTVSRFAGWGPLIGGAPYNIFLMPIPLSYALGLVPALLCGVAYAFWLHAPARRAPGAIERLLFGALCAGLGCAASAALAAGLGFASASDAFALLAPHGVFAGIVLALSRRGRIEVGPVG